MGRGAARLGVIQEEENRARRKYEQDERSLAEKHCQPLACKLQRCANRNTYNQEKCSDLAQEYKLCLANFRNQSQPKE
jgi:hypothetical protein